MLYITCVIVKRSSFSNWKNTRTLTLPDNTHSFVNTCCYPIHCFIRDVIVVYFVSSFVFFLWMKKKLSFVLIRTAAFIFCIFLLRYKAPKKYDILDHLSVLITLLHCISVSVRFYEHHNDKKPGRHTDLLELLILLSCYRDLQWSIRDHLQLLPSPCSLSGDSRLINIIPVTSDVGNGWGVLELRTLHWCPGLGSENFSFPCLGVSVYL